jgi:hypothetical protein
MAAPEGLMSVLLTAHHHSQRPYRLVEPLAVGSERASGRASERRSRRRVRMRIAELPAKSVSADISLKLG